MMQHFKFLYYLPVFAIGLAHAEPHLTVQNKDYPTGSSATEWAEYTLTTGGTVTIKSGANINFTAGNRITLSTGFSVKSGGAFKATASYNPAYNPGGYYNLITPTLALVSGDQQYGVIGQFNLLPFDIAVWNQAGTAPLMNAPVLITVSNGGGWLSTTNNANAVLSKTLHLVTDSDGSIRGYYQQGATELVVSTIKVVAGTQSWEFTTFAYSTTGENADTDGDGISNTTELLLGLNPTQPAQSSANLGLLILSP